MNFPLQDIEQHIDEAWLGRASVFLEKHSFSLEEVEPRIWAVNLPEGDQEYEVEIQLTGRKVKALTCDCATFKASGICTHVVASLYQLRKQKTEEAEAKKREKARRSVASKLTTPTILKQATHAQLEQFVRSYARYDRYFAMRMKAAFVYASEVGVGGEKYDQLMDTVVNTIGSRRKKLNRRAATQLLRVLDVLEGHLEEAVASKEYQEAFYLVESQHMRLIPYLRMMGNQQDDLKAHIFENLQMLKSIYGKPIAPELKLQIAEYVIEQSVLSGNWIWGFTSVFLDMVKMGLPTEDQQSRLLEQIEVILNRKTIADRYKLPYLQIKIDLLKDTGQEEDVEQLIQSNLQQPEILLQALERAKSEEELEQVERLIDIGLKQPFPANVEHQLLLEKLALVEQQGQTDALFELAERLFIRTLDLSFYEKMKATQTNWETQWPAIITYLSNQSYSLERRDAIAEIYYREVAFPELIDYIQHIRSLDLLMRYDVPLRKDARLVIDELYRSLLSQYLSNHLGRQTSVKVRSAIDHLRETRQFKLADELVMNFRAQYPERHSLMEELSEY